MSRQKRLDTNQVQCKFVIKNYRKLSDSRGSFSVESQTSLIKTSQSSPDRLTDLTSPRSVLTEDEVKMPAYHSKASETLISRSKMVGNTPLLPIKVSKPFWKQGNLPSTHILPVYRYQTESLDVRWWTSGAPTLGTPRAAALGHH